MKLKSNVLLKFDRKKLIAKRVLFIEINFVILGILEVIEEDAIKLIILKKTKVNPSRPAISGPFK